MSSQLKDAYGFALLATGEDQRLLQASWAAVSEIVSETAPPTREQLPACPSHRDVFIPGQNRQL
jgi:hypothetical protein